MVSVEPTAFLWQPDPLGKPILRSVTEESLADVSAVQIIARRNGIGA